MEEKRKAELLQIAENCRVVPAHKPKTYWQAIQMYWFVHLGVTSELNPWDSYSPGRLEQHLIRFYRKDVDDGILDDDKAKELLECLWIKFNNQPAPPKVGITLKESSTYTDFANINTGGITPDGRDGVNEVSYLILECMDEMKLLQPSSNVLISRKTPQNFLKKACEISRKGWGQPAFYNTDAIVQELLNAGKTIEDVNEAYEVLSDKNKRERYDLEQNNFKANTTTNSQWERKEEKAKEDKNEHKTENRTEYKREEQPQQSVKEEYNKLEVFELLKENASGVIGAIILGIIFKKLGLSEWLFIAAICCGAYCVVGLASVPMVGILNLFLPKKRKWGEDDNTTLQALIALVVWKKYIFPLFKISKVVDIICMVCLVGCGIMLAEKIVKTVFGSGKSY